ncbi:MAG: hypothetical protein P8170_07755 [Gemmatimonadota bacterium]|jgi:hypothetical protein
MGSSHKRTILDIARDELFSHVIRCDVLEAHMSARLEWLEETLDYMRLRYPQLTDLQAEQLDVLGQRFLKQAIPHGKHATAENRDEWEEGRVPSAHESANTWTV